MAVSRPQKRTAAKSATRRDPSSLAAGVHITHPERVIYPENEITKGDLAAYYALIAERMLPHVAGRPLSLVRCPDGTANPCFFQKHPPLGLSKAVERVRIREKSGFGTYAAVHDGAGLLSLVQFNAVEIHVWGSKADDVERPDRIVFDLDPDPGVTWKLVVEAALEFRRLLKELGLSCFVKTTGGKGLHVVSPIRPERKWNEIKNFCRGVAEILERAAPSRYVTNMSKAKRSGKVFLDYLRNDRGATWVAPYSVRARPGAPISMPVDWKDLLKIKSGDAFTLTGISRLLQRRTDPWKSIGRSARSVSDAIVRAVQID